jgi:hypothetical protein
MPLYWSCQRTLWEIVKTNLLTGLYIKLGVLCDTREDWQSPALAPDLMPPPTVTGRVSF